MKDQKEKLLTVSQKGRLLLIGCAAGIAIGMALLGGIGAFVLYIFINSFG